MQTLVPDWTDAPSGVRALGTRRAGGASLGPYGAADGTGGGNLGTHVDDDPAAVARNRAALQSLLPAEPVWLAQVHGATVVDAARVDGVPEADASIAAAPGVVCAILTADCLPMLLADRRGRVVGAAHAGWRGLAAGVLQNTACAMRAAGADEIVAWLGPAIGPQRFEVGAEVREVFASQRAAAAAAFAPVEGKPGKFLADIYLLARQALAEEGVTGVSGGSFCTVADASRFYSYRRDGRTGRMAALVWIDR
ncbi:MAG: peptidoglycan editing factor PgeF [Burkholderiaceae bacterium]